MHLNHHLRLKWIGWQVVQGWSFTWSKSSVRTVDGRAALTAEARPTASRPGYRDLTPRRDPETGRGGSWLTGLV